MRLVRRSQDDLVNPRLGLIAYATATGLGYQTRAVHDHMHPARTLVIDLSRDKGLPLHPEWFPGARIASSTLTGDDIDWILTDIDLLFVCETPITYEVFQVARERGIRSVLHFNFEFLEYLSNAILPKPSLFAAPSPWNLDRIPNGRCPIVWTLPVPIDPTGLPRRVITEARTFLHVAGRPAVKDRNGTLDFLELARRCQDLGARWILACQAPTPEILDRMRGLPVELLREQVTPGDLYAAGDVMVLPRRYGGLSIPALEAVTVGMPVLMPDTPPNDSWLPGEWLSPVGWVDRFRAKTLIDVYAVDIRHLEAKVRGLWRDPGMVADWAARARQIAAGHTWDALTPTWRDALARVMDLPA